MFDFKSLPLDPGVYMIRCTVNRKCYVGASKSVRTRLRQHEWNLRHGTHYSKAMLADFTTYGPQAFTARLLERVRNLRQLSLMERKWFVRFIPEYCKLVPTQRRRNNRRVSPMPRKGDRERFMRAYERAHPEQVTTT